MLKTASVSLAFLVRFLSLTIRFFFSFFFLCFRCFLVFQEHGMKFLRVFKLNVGTLYLADGKNQVAYFQILHFLLLLFFSQHFRLFPHREYHNTARAIHISELRKKLEVSFSFLCFFLVFFFLFLFCGICVCKVENFSRFLFLFPFLRRFSLCLLWELRVDFSLLGIF